MKRARRRTLLPLLLAFAGALPAARADDCGAGRAPDEAATLATYRESETYRKTLRLCQSRPQLLENSFDDVKLFVDVVAESTSQSFSLGFSYNPDAFSQFVHDAGASHGYATLLSSPEFNLAISDCAKHDPERIAAVKTRLLIADRTGKALGAAATVGATLATVGAVKLISRALSRINPGAGGKAWRRLEAPLLAASLLIQGDRLGEHDDHHGFSDLEVRRALNYLDGQLSEDPTESLRRTTDDFRATLRATEADLANSTLARDTRERLEARRQTLRGVIESYEHWIDWIDERRTADTTAP